MKRIFLLFVLFLFFAVNLQSQVNIIPQPVEMKTGQGFFVMNGPASITHAANPEVKRIADGLAARLTKTTGFNVTAGASSGQISLNLNAAADARLGSEGYQLKVAPGGVQISANTAAGLFWGVQSFMQLLPAEVEGVDKADGLEWKAPAVEITDYPRFGWRGLMLDVSRHFFTKEEVKRFIDDMVKYKYNLLHFHLTDDHGWRVEIKSYPKLTEVGAWRVKKEGRFGTFTPADPSEPRDYGGFYTQNDIRDLVQYARERYVNILPEIDVPGHSLAAIASYPELVATPGKYYVSSGEKFMEWPPKGHFYGLIDNALNPASEKVYQFLDKVFGEIAQLFPFDYIHMGGDETARNFWEKSAEIKALMQRENLKNLDEVQAYFVTRVNKIINSKGKKMIGWDEILDGGLTKGAAVMSWRAGNAGAFKSSKAGHEIVMTPQDFVYLDYMQGDVLMEPRVYASLRMKKAYVFDPTPAGVDPKLVKGGQANVWTEQIYNLRHLQYMTWPRAMATSEVLWSPAGVRNWNGFVDRVENHLPRLQEAGTKYGVSMYEPDVRANKKPNGIELVLVPEIEGLSMHYSFDNSYPDEHYPRYTAPVLVPKDAETLRILTYKNGGQVGRIITVPVSVLKERAK